MPMQQETSYDLIARKNKLIIRVKMSLILILLMPILTYIQTNKTYAKNENYVRNLEI